MSYVENISEEMLNKINKADAIVIGIGQGLTTEGGISFESNELLKEWLPEYDQIHFSNIKELLRNFKWFNRKEVMEYWSFWVPFIQKLRYETPVLESYSDLYEVIKDKNYFIITSTYDAQPLKSGFNPDRIFTPDGDLAYFQCARPCTYDIYPNKKTISKMYHHLDIEDKVREDLIPLCPSCGDYLIPNVRTDENFTAEPYLENIRDYEKFLDDNEDSNLLLLEFGEGFENPMIIRYPFENMTEKNPNAHLIRFNETEFEVPSYIEDRSTVITEDIGKVLHSMREKL